MGSGPLQAVVRHLRRMAQPKTGGLSSDAELLTRFIEQRDEQAFAEIVRLHGPLVWALCRSRLSTADADDAFQATFVVLARQAARIRKRASLACWLSSVARRVIQRARAQDNRRRVAEGRAEVRGSQADVDILEREEWRDVLNEELHRLPEKYRLPLILCYFQGLTNEEAARRLGWPHGTVCGRLSRARDLLRRRLTRRGVTLTAGARTMSICGPPAELLAATARAWGQGLGTAATGAAVGNSVIQIAEGVMNAIWLTKVKMWAAGSVAVVVLGSGTAGWVLGPGKAQGQKPDQLALQKASLPTTVEQRQQPPPQPPDPTADADKIIQFLRDNTKPSPLSEAAAADDELRALRKERHRVAVRELQLRNERYRQGVRQETVDVLIHTLKRLIESEVALSQRPGDHIAAYQRGIALSTFFVLVAENRLANGLIPEQDMLQIRYFDRDLKIKLLELQAQGAAK